MSVPDFSILIRTTGGRWQLATALGSVAAQTLEPERFEVVLINDGGPSIAELADSASRSFEMRLVELSAHVGKSGAINSGFERSRGRYICILDDDDVYYPSHLEVLFAAAQRHPDARILFTDTDVALADEQSGMRIIGNQVWEFDRSELMMMRKAPIACSMCIRRDAWSAVGGFDERFTRVL
ncbi:MAG: glycosyltransferase family A protein, partial [Acidimicrobiales bacterium]